MGDATWVIVFTVDGELTTEAGVTHVVPGTPDADQLAELGCDAFFVSPSEHGVIVMVELDPTVALSSAKPHALKAATAVLDKAQALSFAPSGPVLGVIAEYGPTIAEIFKNND